MYGKCMETMVCGTERWREPKNNFIPVFADPNYKDQKNAERILQFYRWNKKLSNFKSNRINGESKCLWTKKSYRVDGRGLLPNKKELIIEIYGDKAHCCPIHKEESNKIHHTRKTYDGEPMTYAEIEKEDKARLLTIKKCWPEAEILVVYMCEFDRDFTKKNGVYNKIYEEFISLFPEYKQDKMKKTEENILNEILNEKIHGFILADFEINDDLKKRTEAFPLFFKKTFVGKSDLGSEMNSYLEKEGKLKTPQLELISSHFAKNHLISTNLCKFYLELGVKVSNVQWIIQYDITTKLKDLVNRACDLRFNASEQKNKEEMTLGNLAKQLVVASYGRMLLNPANFTSVRYADEDGLLKATYQGEFSLVDYVGEIDGSEYYEIKGKKKKRTYCYPQHMGAWVLNTSKLIMLKLVYNVIEPCFDPRSYSYFVTQTDSLSIICSEDNCDAWFDKCVLPEKRAKFDELRKIYFVIPGNSEKARKSKFTAGIFKVEWTADYVVGVSAKVYAAYTEQSKIVKLSCRSVPAMTAKSLTFDDFCDVLFERKPINVKIESFNFINGAMYREIMSKCAVTAMYIKRIVLSDNSTKTLNL